MWQNEANGVAAFTFASHCSFSFAEAKLMPVNPYIICGLVKVHLHVTTLKWYSTDTLVIVLDGEESDDKWRALLIQQEVVLAYGKANRKCKLNECSFGTHYFVISLVHRGLIGEWFYIIYTRVKTRLRLITLIFSSFIYGWSIYVIYRT